MCLTLLRFVGRSQRQGFGIKEANKIETNEARPVSCCCCRTHPGNGGLRNYQVITLPFLRSGTQQGLTRLRSRGWQGPCFLLEPGGENPFPSSSSFWGPPASVAHGPVLCQQSRRWTFWSTSDPLFCLPLPHLRTLAVTWGPPGYSRIIPLSSSQPISTSISISSLKYPREDSSNHSKVPGAGRGPFRRDQASAYPSK